MEQAVLVEKIVALTGEIEHATAIGDWIEAARLAEIRSPLLMSLSGQQTPAALDAIRSVMTRDSAIVADAQHSQSELQSEFNEAMRRSKAVGLYHQTARL